MGGLFLSSHREKQTAGPGERELFATLGGLLLLC
jgi:hypothetical protein